MRKKTWEYLAVLNKNKTYAIKRRFQLLGSFIQIMSACKIFREVKISLKVKLVSYPNPLAVHSHIDIRQIVNELYQSRNNSIQTIC